jgi:hypothetical protein
LANLWSCLPNLQKLILCFQSNLSTDVIQTAITTCPLLDSLTLINNSQFNHQLLRILSSSSRVFSKLTIDSSQNLRGAAIKSWFPTIQVKDLTLLGPFLQGDYLTGLHSNTYITNLTLAGNQSIPDDIYKLVTSNNYLSRISIIKPAITSHQRALFHAISFPNFVMTSETNSILLKKIQS